jgi:hypothetical protein
MNDHNLPLSIYLLRPDRVQAFEEKLLGPGQLNLPLTQPLDDFVLPLRNRETTPERVTVLKSALQNPDGLSLTGQSAGVLLVVRHAERLSF